MVRTEASAAEWVQTLQALTARELVEEMGVSQREAAARLGVAPSAISQYLGGQRMARGFDRLAADPRARRVARSVADELGGRPGPGGARTTLLLEGARALSAITRGGAPPSRRWARPPDTSAEREVRALSKWLRQRVGAEQRAVTECMRLAQKARDELTRAIFRQIASDSLRHAEIVASLSTYLDRGVARAAASGVTPEEVAALMEAERRAEARADAESAQHLGGTMSLLIASMEADERKHAELLEGLLRSGFAPGEPRRRPSRRSPPRR